jgi:predicted dienelactone hydrolase
LSLAISIALPILVPVFRIPQPTGAYAIGTLTYHWVDRSRPETFTSDPNDRRELMVQIWYPAAVGPSSPTVPYLDDPSVLVPLAGLLRLPGFVFGHLKYVTTNAVASAPVAAGRSSYPVLVYSPGRGGFRQEDSWLIEELVSRGYVVAAIDHPYAASGVAFPDGRAVLLDPRMLDRSFVDGKIPYLAQDAVFALDQLGVLDRSDPNGILTGRLDVQSVGIFGVSLGGEVAAEACRRDSRFRACQVMDVWMPADVLRSGLTQPTMFLTRDAKTMQLEAWSQADISETLGTMRAVYQKLPGDGYFVTVPGLFHQDFSDAPLLSPLTSLAGITGSIDRARAHDITTAYTLAFFDRELLGRPEALLEGAAKQYPEVRVEARRR